MPEERKQMRIGDLLMHSGIVTSEYIKDALQNFEQRGLPIGKVLVMSGYLSEQQLRTALEVQSLLNDGLLPLDVAINVLQIAHKDKLALSDAFQNSGFVQPEDQQTPGYVLHITAQVFVALIRRDGLIAPARKGMSRSGGDSLAVFCRDLADSAAQARYQTHDRPMTAGAAASARASVTTRPPGVTGAVSVTGVLESKHG